MWTIAKCWEPEPHRLKSEHVERDDSYLFGDDTIEVFLDANHDGTSYFHLGANYKSVKIDVQRRPSEHGVGWDVIPWNGEWEVATRVEQEYWTSEWSIPFATLGVNEETPTTWGISICRGGPPGTSMWGGAVVHLGSPP